MSKGRQKHSFSGKSLKGGILYVVGTPIGNPDDITRRAINILSEADLIVGEDTRRVRGLLRGAGITTSARIASFHERSGRSKGGVERGQSALKSLQNGLNVALVTDSGTPGISDPGHNFVREALKLGAKVVPIPGPSALTAAISVSSIKAVSDFTFIGYPPLRNARRKKLFQALFEQNRPFIFFESPRRAIQTLNDIIEITGDVQISVAREMTKSYEEFFNGRIREFLEQYVDKDVLGELTVIVSPKKEGDEDSE